MALTTSEVTRIKAELGYNALLVGAEPYIGVTRLFEQVIAVYLQSGATTTSSTTVTASSSPSLVTYTLADATGFTAGDRVIIDVDSRQEAAIVESVSGSTIKCLTQFAHSGTYTITVEGGESIVREWLNKLRALTAPGGPFDQASSKAGIKRVDEIEFKDGSGGVGNTLSELKALQSYYRDELASVLGVVNMRSIRGGGGGSFSVY
jgi:hypothetical protein